MSAFWSSDTLSARSGASAFNFVRRSAMWPVSVLYSWLMFFTEVWKKYILQFGTNTSLSHGIEIHSHSAAVSFSKEYTYIFSWWTKVSSRNKHLIFLSTVLLDLPSLILRLVQFFLNVKEGKSATPEWHVCSGGNPAVDVDESHSVGWKLYLIFDLSTRFSLLYGCLEIWVR